MFLSAETRSPCFTKQETYASRKIQLWRPVKQQPVFTSVNLGLRIRFLMPTGAKQDQDCKDRSERIFELIEQNTKNPVAAGNRKTYVNLTTTSDKYRIITDQVTAFAESFRSAEVRFNAGAINSVDYLIAKNNLDRANNNLIVSKYDFVLRKKSTRLLRRQKPLW